MPYIILRFNELHSYICISRLGFRCLSRLRYIEAANADVEKA